MKTGNYYEKTEMESAFKDGSWQSVVFKEFKSALMSEERPFPCVYGVAGMRNGHLRYGFSENMSAAEIAPMLRHFVRSSHSYGNNTSLVVFSRPNPQIRGIRRYEDKFWRLLLELTALDEHPQPENVPLQLDDPLWEFCFAGEPFFAVCSTPAHVLRQSRRASAMMVTFQPRWVFDKLSAAPEAAVSPVRERLRQYDLIEPSPHLGFYGAPDNREYAQYFLRENNGEVSCPFRTLRGDASLSEGKSNCPDVQIIKGPTFDLNDLASLIMSCVPDQGCVEIQHDQEGKEHPWHAHQEHETIVILEGRLRFYWTQGEEICCAGDVIKLFKGTKHGSVALEGGAKYLIASELLQIP